MKLCRQRGWKAIKFDSERHAPDRIVLIPGGKICFIEFKQPGKLPRAGQIDYMDELRYLGFNVNCLDDADRAIEWVEEVLRYRSEDVFYEEKV